MAEKRIKKKYKKKQFGIHKRLIINNRYKSLVCASGRNFRYVKVIAADVIVSKPLFGICSFCGFC